jgi:hypothetical protein
LRPSLLGKTLCGKLSEAHYSCPLTHLSGKIRLPKTLELAGPNPIPDDKAMPPNKPFP